MYLVLDKENNLILAVSNTLSYQINGDPLCDDYAIASCLVGSIVEVDNIPDEVVAYDYLYNDGVYTRISKREPSEDILETILVADLDAAYQEGVNEA